MPREVRRSHVYASAVCGVVLASCSSSGDAATSKNADLVSVGVFHPFTGPLAPVVLDVESNYDVGAFVVNAGLDHGATVGMELAKYDTQGNAEMAASAITSALEDGIGYYLGEISSAATKVMLDHTVPAGALTFSMSSADGLTDQDNQGLFFRTANRASLPGRTLAKGMFDEGSTRIGIIASNHVYDSGISDVVQASFTSKTCGDSACALTKRTVHARETPTSEMNYAGDVAALIASGADGILLATSAEHGLNYMHAISDSAYKGTIWVTDVISFNPDVKAVAGSVITRMRYLQLIEYQGRHLDAWKRIMDEHGVTLTAGTSTSFTFDTVLVLGLAMNKAGAGASPRDVADAFLQIANPPGKEVGPGEYDQAIALLKAGEELDYHGASGTFDFNENYDRVVEYTPVRWDGTKGVPLFE